MKIKSQNFNTWTWKIIREMRTLEQLEFRHSWPDFTQNWPWERKKSPNHESVSRYPDIPTSGHLQSRTYERIVGNLDKTFPFNYQNKYIRRGKSQKMEIHSQSRSILVNRLHNLGSTHRFVGNSHLKYRFKPVNKIPDSLKFKTWSSWLGKTRVFIFLKFKRLKFIYKMQY